MIKNNTDDGDRITQALGANGPGELTEALYTPGTPWSLTYWIVPTVNPGSEEFALKCGTTTSAWLLSLNWSANSISFRWISSGDSISATANIALAVNQKTLIGVSYDGNVTATVFARSSSVSTVSGSNTGSATLNTGAGDLVFGNNNATGSFQGYRGPLVFRDGQMSQPQFDAIWGTDIHKAFKSSVGTAHKAGILDAYHFGIMLDPRTTDSQGSTINSNASAALIGGAVNSNNQLHYHRASSPAAYGDDASVAGKGLTVIGGFTFIDPYTTLPGLWNPQVSPRNHGQAVPRISNRARQIADANVSGTVRAVVTHGSLVGDAEDGDGLTLARNALMGLGGSRASILKGIGTAPYELQQPRRWIAVDIPPDDAVLTSGSLQEFPAFAGGDAGFFASMLVRDNQHRGLMLEKDASVTMFSRVEDGNGTLLGTTTKMLDGVLDCGVIVLRGPYQDHQVGVRVRSQRVHGTAQDDVAPEAFVGLSDFFVNTTRSAAAKLVYDENDGDTYISRTMTIANTTGLDILPGDGCIKVKNPDVADKRDGNSVESVRVESGNTIIVFVDDFSDPPENNDILRFGDTRIQRLQVQHTQDFDPAKPWRGLTVSAPDSWCCIYDMSPEMLPSTSGLVIYGIGRGGHEYRQLLDGSGKLQKIILNGVYPWTYPYTEMHVAFVIVLADVGANPDGKHEEFLTALRAAHPGIEVVFVDALDGPLDENNDGPDNFDAWHLWVADNAKRLHAAYVPVLKRPEIGDWETRLIRGYQGNKRHWSYAGFKRFFEITFNEAITQNILRPADPRLGQDPRRVPASGGQGLSGSSDTAGEALTRRPSSSGLPPRIGR